MTNIPRPLHKAISYCHNVHFGRPQRILSKLDERYMK